MFMYTCWSVMLLFSVQIHSYEIERRHHVFTLNDISCNELPHEHSWFYGSACSRWKSNVRRYHNSIVQCIIETVHDTNGSYEQSKCTPVMDTSNYDVHAIYTVTKNDVLKMQSTNSNTCLGAFDTTSKHKMMAEYELVVDAELQYTTHPITQLFMVIFILYTFYCIAHVEDEHFDRMVWYAFLYGYTGTCANVMYYIYNNHIHNPTTHMHISLDTYCADHGFRQVITALRE